MDFTRHIDAGVDGADDLALDAACIAEQGARLQRCFLLRRKSRLDASIAKVGHVPRRALDAGQGFSRTTRQLNAQRGSVADTRGSDYPASGLCDLTRFGAERGHLCDRATNRGNHGQCFFFGADVLQERSSCTNAARHLCNLRHGHERGFPHLHRDRTLCDLPLCVLAEAAENVQELAARQVANHRVADTYVVQWIRNAGGLKPLACKVQGHQRHVEHLQRVGSGQRPDRIRLADAAHDVLHLLRARYLHRCRLRHVAGGALDGAQQAARLFLLLVLLGTNPGSHAQTRHRPAAVHLLGFRRRRRAQGPRIAAGHAAAADV